MHVSFHSTVGNSCFILLTVPFPHLWEECEYSQRLDYQGGSSLVGEGDGVRLGEGGAHKGSHGEQRGSEGDLHGVRAVECEEDLRGCDVDVEWARWRAECRPALFLYPLLRLGRERYLIPRRGARPA